MRKHQIVFVLVYSDKLCIYCHLLSYDYDALLGNVAQQKDFMQKLHMFPCTHICLYPSISLRGNFEALMTRNGVPLEYLMVFEAMRLTSFFGLNIAVSRIKLAKAGFYATGDGDETRCFSCGVRYKNWREGDRPDHVTHKHNCQHSHGSHRGNVPFAENPLPLTTDITSSRLWYPTSDYDLHDPQPEIHDAQPEIHPPYTAPSNGRPRPLTSSALGSWSGSDYHTPDYTQETDRLASFRGWPNESGPTPRQLAAAGFCYTGFQDKVRCFCCGVGLWKWDKEDEPWQEHVRFRPNCRFLAERYPADTSLQVTGSSSNAIQPRRAAMKLKNEFQDRGQSNRCKLCVVLPASIVFLPCGHLVVCVMCKHVIQRCPVCSISIRGCVRVHQMSHQSSRPPSSDFTHRDQFPEIPTMPIMPPNHRPTCLMSSASNPQTGTNYHAPDYCRESDRLTSFQGWPSKRRPTPQQLATAGFYYTGVMDIVRCFSCGVILRKVDEEDDPRQEHARFRPNCSFLADTTPQVTGTSSNEMYPQRATAKRNTESQDKRESRLCKICLEDPASIIFLPCGHVVVCDECASALERCPVCLKHILGTVRVYKADAASRQKRTDNK